MPKAPTPAVLNLLKISADDALHFSNPILHPALMWSATEIERSVADVCGRELAFEPTIATMPSAPINALSLRATSGTTPVYVIIFNRGLSFFFIYLIGLLGKVLTRTTNGKLELLVDGDLAIERVHESVAAQYDFARIFGSYLIRGSPLPMKGEGGWAVGDITEDDPTTIDTSSSRAFLEGHTSREEFLGRLAREGVFKDSVTSALHLFVTGHEYAHIINEDFDRPVSSTDTTGFLSRNYEQEHRADWLGLNLSLHTQCGRGNVAPFLSYGGAELFFTACGLLEKGADIFSYASESPYVKVGDASHPTPKRRREVLRKNLHRIVGDEVADVCMKFADVIALTMRELWDCTKHHLDAELRKGTRLHPIWMPPANGYAEANEMNQRISQGEFRNMAEVLIALNACIDKSRDEESAFVWICDVDEVAKAVEPGFAEETSES